MFCDADDVRKCAWSRQDENGNEYRYTACGHEYELWSIKTRKQKINELEIKLRKYIDEFDAFVVCGASMMTVGSILADRLDKNIVLVRKRSDKVHSDYFVEGVWGQRCVFVDDLIASGSTFDYVKECAAVIDCTIVGVLLYSEMVVSRTIKGVKNYDYKERQNESTEGYTGHCGNFYREPKEKNSDGDSGLPGDFDEHAIPSDKAIKFRRHNPVHSTGSMSRCKDSGTRRYSLRNERKRGIVSNSQKICGCVQRARTRSYQRKP